MKRFYILFTLVFSASLSASGGNCPKCEIMKKYISEHPGSHVYYEDYLESLKNKDSGEKKASDEKLPDDVRQIMNQEKVSSVKK